MHNPNVHVAQNYNIVEDLAQDPWVVPTLKLLQIFPTKHKSLLSTVGGMDPFDN